MKFALASAMLIGTTVAFSGPTFVNRNVALKMSAVETETFSFTKSEEMFAEAKTVSVMKHEIVELPVNDTMNGNSNHRG